MPASAALLVGDGVDEFRLELDAPSTVSIRGVNSISGELRMHSEIRLGEYHPDVWSVFRQLTVIRTDHHRA